MLVGDGEVSLEFLQEKLIGDVSRLNVLLWNPGDVSRNDLLDSLDNEGDIDDENDENSSVGENEGRKALGSRGVDVRDLHDVYVGDGSVRLRDGSVGDLGGRGGRLSDRSDLDTGRWRFMSDLEIVLGTSRYIEELGRDGQS